MTRISETISGQPISISLYQTANTNRHDLHSKSASSPLDSYLPGRLILTHVLEGSEWCLCLTTCSSVLKCIHDQRTAWRVIHRNSVMQQSLCVFYLGCTTDTTVIAIQWAEIAARQHVHSLTHRFAAQRVRQQQWRKLSGSVDRVDDMRGKGLLCNSQSTLVFEPESNT